MSETYAFELDESLERAIIDERLDGRQALMDDLRGGIHAKAVIAELQAAQTSNREACVIPGDLEMRHVANIPAQSFHILYQQHAAEGDLDDRLEWGLKRNPHLRVKYTPRTTTVFIGSKYEPPTA